MAKWDDLFNAGSNHSNKELVDLVPGMEYKTKITGVKNITTKSGHPMLIVNTLATGDSGSNFMSGLYMVNSENPDVRTLGKLLEALDLKGELTKSLTDDSTAFDVVKAAEDLVAGAKGKTFYAKAEEGNEYNGKVQYNFNSWTVTKYPTVQLVGGEDALDLDGVDSDPTPVVVDVDDLF